MAEPDKKLESYYVFPAEEDDILIPRVGLLTIDYRTGEVQARGQGIRIPQLQGRLEDIHRKAVRSIHIETDKTIRYYTNVGSNKKLIRVRGGDVWETELQPFQKLFIKILERNTRIMIVGSKVETISSQNIQDCGKFPSFQTTPGSVTALIRRKVDHG